MIDPELVAQYKSLVEDGYVSFVIKKRMCVDGFCADPKLSMRTFLDIKDTYERSNLRIILAKKSFEHSEKTLKLIWTRIEEIISLLKKPCSIESRLELEKELEDLTLVYSQSNLF